MTNKELLAYANEHYKPGVSFKSIFCDGGAIREIQFWNKEDHIGWRLYEGEISAYNGIYSPPGSGYYASATIYRKGEWAPIIQNYEIY